MSRNTHRLECFLFAISRQRERIANNVAGHSYNIFSLNGDRKTASAAVHSVSSISKRFFAFVKKSSFRRLRLCGAGGAVLRRVAGGEEEALPLRAAVGDVVGVEVAVVVVAALDAARVLVEEVEEEDVDDVHAVHVARDALVPPSHASWSRRHWGNGFNIISVANLVTRIRK